MIGICAYEEEGINNYNISPKKNREETNNISIINSAHTFYQNKRLASTQFKFKANGNKMIFNTIHVVRSYFLFTIIVFTDSYRQKAGTL